MKTVETATHPGMCFICAQPIGIGDPIVCSFLGANPVAAYARSVIRSWAIPRKPLRINP